MKRLMVLIVVTLLIPAAMMTKGECQDDVQKFCKNVRQAKGRGGRLPLRAALPRRKPLAKRLT
jgi:hypothetical protein